jgi:F420-0:gamma-glutamyl ligase-like protein
MKLLLRRDQRQGLLGKAVFTLEVRADLSAEERTNIQKYKLGDTELYASHDIGGGSGLLGVASRLAYRAITIHVSVNDLANGKKVECKDIVEMLAIEEQIRQAAQTFKEVLEAAANFGGEEALELA